MLRARKAPPMALSQAEQARNRYASLRRRRPGSPEETAAHRELVEANISAYVERAVADAPPLTREQRDRIASLLRGSVVR